MAKYYAITKDGYIQQDLTSGQLEIYETKVQAESQCRKGYKIIKVKVKRAKKLYVGMPVDMTKPDWWEDD